MGTHYHGTPAEIRALNAYIKLVRCASAVGARLEAPLLKAGFTENQFGILEVLLHLGPLPQRELGAKLFTSRPQVTKLIDQLEERGLVRRERSAEDRRSTFVRLTPKGRRLIEAHFPVHLERIVAEFSILDARELEELARLCRKLGRRAPAIP